MTGFSGFLLKLFGWSVDISVPDYPKCIICVAPHTSNWDFIVGKLAYASVGRKAGFLMKDTWFFWPLGVFFRSIGGIAVPRRKLLERPLTEIVTEKFRNADCLALAITPEGTRSRNAVWHTGFLHIAYESNIPVVLAIIDYKLKIADVTDVFLPTGNIEADMKQIKEYYRNASGKYPQNFTID